MDYFIFLLSPLFVFAAEKTQPSPSNKTPATVKLINPLDPSGTGEVLSPQVLIGKIISAVLGLVGSLALAMFIWGGFNWMTAAGSSEKVQKGKDIMIWATLGLIVIFASYALVLLVFKTLGVS